MINQENVKFFLFSLITLVVGLLSTYLLSNYFTVAQFGQIQLLLALIGISSIFYLSGFDIVIMKAIYAKNDALVFYVFYRIMPFSLGLFLMVSVIYFYFFEQYQDLLKYVIPIIIFAMFEKSNAILNAKLMFKELRYMELISKLILLTITIYVVWSDDSLEQYFLFFVCFSVLIYVLRTTYALNTLTIDGIKKDFKEETNEGYKVAFSTGYTIIASWIEKLILGFIGIESLAIFVIGQLFPKVIKDNIKILLLPSLSMWASKGFNYYQEQIIKYSYILWSIGIFFYIMLFFLVELIIGNFFTEYESSIQIAQLLSITLVFKFIELAKMSSFSLTEHTNIFNKINNITNTLKIALVVILVPVFGIYGAVVSIIFMETIRFLLVSKNFNRLTRKFND